MPRSGDGLRPIRRAPADAGRANTTGFRIHLGFPLRMPAARAHYHHMDPNHISVHDAERYYLGLVTDEDELAWLEEHYLWCQPCLDLVTETEDYVDVMRVALLNVQEA